MITNPWFCGVGKLRSQGSSNALALRCHGRFVEAPCYAPKTSFRFFLVRKEAQHLWACCPAIGIFLYFIVCLIMHLRGCWLAAPWRSKVFLFYPASIAFHRSQTERRCTILFLFLSHLFLFFMAPTIPCLVNPFWIQYILQWSVSPRLIARHGSTPKCLQQVRWESIARLPGSVLFELFLHGPVLHESWIHSLARHGTISNGVAMTLLALASTMAFGDR